MLKHWKSPNSQHRIPLSSLARDFILQKPSLIPEVLQIQIYQNEVHVKDLSPTSFRRSTPPDEVFQKILNELTKKAKLYKVKGFDRLSLSFSSCESMTEVSLQYLKKILIQNFSGIQSLALNFYLYTRFPIKRPLVGIIAELISYFKDLRSLQIRLVAFREIKDSSIKLLIKQIHASHKNLKNLHIDISTRMDSLDLRKEPPRPDLFERMTQLGHGESFLSWQNRLSEKGIRAMNLAMMRYFRTLQELNLNFCLIVNNRITDRICQELGQGILENMGYLKRLSLNFCGCDGLTNEAMRLFSKTKKRRLTGLEHLTLELAGVKIDDIGLKLLEEGICLQFKNLKRLVINLMSNEQITDEGLVGFNQNIVQNLTSLQSFTLAGYWGSNIRSEGVKSISHDICKHLKNLKELVLMFSLMDNSVLPAICSDIEENSVHLEKLSLSLEMPSSRYYDLGKFTHVLRTTLKDIVELNLDFPGNGDQINNEIIMELGESLEGLAKLKRLALVFDGCGQIGQDGTSDLKLGVIVPKTAILEKFEANFRQCYMIRDEHVDEFGASLCEFQKGLRVLNVNFTWCEFLTDKSYKKLCYGIKHDMENLEDLELGFYIREEISEKLKTEMKVIFKEVPLVNLY